VVGLAAAAGPAMQIDRGDAVGAADGFDVNLVAVADGELLRRQGVRTDRRVSQRIYPRRRQAASSPPVSSVPTGEVAIDETVIVRRRLRYRQLENLLMHRRQRAGRVGIAGIAGEREGLAAAAAEAISLNSQLWHGSGIQPVPR